MKEEFLRYEYGHVREAKTYKYFYVRFLCIKIKFGGMEIEKNIQNTLFGV